MCKILFSESGSTVCIAKDLKVEDAIQFALNLHRSSNLQHTISVQLADNGSIMQKSVLILENK